MYPHHQGQAPQGVQWPIYGLPPGYTPPVLTNTPENHTPATNLDPQSQMPQGVQWPPYGLPPGYTPPQLTNPKDNNTNTTAANTDPQNQAQQLDPGQTTNETSTPPPPFPTFMSYPFLPTTNTPPNTFQPPNFYLDSQGRPVIPQPVPLLVSTTQPKDTMVNDPHSREKLQVLEDRLRAIEGHLFVRDVADIKTPMEFIFEELCKVGEIEKKGDSRKVVMCAVHPDVEHSIEEGEKFKEILQSLIDSELVQISREKDERRINVVQGSEDAQNQTFPGVPMPLTLHGTHNTHAPTCHGPRPITIQVPSPFSYKNSKAVPWKYDVQVKVGDVQGNRVDPSIGPGAPAVTNISGIGGMTRSGRIYTSKELQEVKEKELAKEKGKEKEKEGVVKKEEPNASYTKEGAPIVGPHFSKASMMMAKTMLEKGYQHGQGLGKTMKGMVDVLRLCENKDKFGLGYKATPTDRRRVAEEKKEKRLARLENREPVTRGYPCQSS
ncbi:G-patch domain [Sesbania bispinosa]|nr:G-patch domain [Sesbania bispinosa]